MIVEFGHFALCLALAVACAQAAAPILGLRRDDPGLLRVADAAAQLQLVCLALAFAALAYAFVVSDFSVELVAKGSHSTKPLLYRVTGVWANHEGSMLLWVLILALFGAGIATFGRGVPLAVRARALSVQAMIGVGFLAFILLTSNPFARLALPPMDGMGMNPLLQDVGVALHPPMLYLGYVGFSTAFSFAVAALWRGRVDPAWARWARPWVLAAWASLTGGIALGSWWAYYELGWGGFWFWDPVENASFMPWLLGTALLHSTIVVEKRDCLQKWTILLAIFTFGMSLLGTFLVRSGVLDSVHAFAVDPERGLFILFLIVAAMAGALTLYALRAHRLVEGGVFAPISREGALLLNNLLLAAACGVVFVGTLYPLALDVLTGARITVGPPYFNKSFLPIFGLTALVSALGPFLPWKRADMRGLGQRAGAVLLAAGLAASAFWLFGWRAPMGLVGGALAAWLFAATVADVLRRAGGGAFGARLRRLIGAPLQVWGLWLGHGGMAIAIAGVTAVSVYASEAIQAQKPGAPVTVGGYVFTLKGVSDAPGPNYRTIVARIEASKDGAPVAILRPERRWYPVERQPTTEAAIVSLWHGDLYAVLGDPDGAGGWVTRYHVKPGAPWMWLGAALMTLGGVASLCDRRLRVGAPAAKRAAKRAAAKNAARGGGEAAA